MHIVVYLDIYRGNMRENRQADYKTVRGLSRGLLLLNLLNKFDGGATIGTLAEFSGLHRTTVRRLLETLQEEGYVRRSRSDDSFRLTLKIRQLSEGFRDEHWISALATPLLGELLREVLWPTDISTLDVDAMVVRETTHALQPPVVSSRDGRPSAPAAADRLGAHLAGPFARII
ncbi:YiaKLMNOPQRS operon repressor [Raoultella planticola]|uniref:YiaKLMNOPQRS operon repressor n=1 Tax=Raoultella planticola TaxID=575 RepID=A0A485AL26_RAOPL|nr:YiaKLMNOPQRS operon repressor [Raoultella planticola]